MSRTTRDGAYRAPVVGLLGAAAGGKSTVAALLAAHGAAVVDADRVGHEVLEEPDVREALQREFGPQVFGPDGRVARRKLAELVFADAGRLQRLDDLVHPRICDRVRQQVAEQRRNEAAPMVVLDAALLLEKGLDSCCDVLVFVQSDPEQRRERAGRDRGWSGTELADRDAAQMEPEEKRRRADYVIVNTGTTRQLAESVDKLFKQIRQKIRT